MERESDRQEQDSARALEGAESMSRAERFYYWALENRRIYKDFNERIDTESARFHERYRSPLAENIPRELVRATALDRAHLIDFAWDFPKVRSRYAVLGEPAIEPTHPAILRLEHRLELNGFGLINCSDWFYERSRTGLIVYLRSPAKAGLLAAALFGGLKFRDYLDSHPPGRKFYGSSRDETHVEALSKLVALFTLD